MNSEASILKNLIGEQPVGFSRSGSDNTGARRLLSVQDVSHIVNRGRTSLYQMMKDGDFPKAVKVGASTRWLSSDIEAWLQSLKERGAQ